MVVSLSVDFFTFYRRSSRSVRLLAGIALSAALAAGYAAPTTDSATVAPGPEPFTTSYQISTTAPLTAAAIGDGVWWEPELNETSVTAMLQNLRSMNIQNVYVDVFRSGETLFPSAVFPQRADARDRDWLAYITAESHRYDIRVHAWTQTLCWRDAYGSYLLTNPTVEARADELDVTVKERVSDGVTLARYANPAVPGVTAALTSLTEEICRYDVDGLNLDAIQYNPRADMGYHPALVAEFEEATGINPRRVTPDMADDSPWMRWTIYREDKLTSLVAAISEICNDESERRDRPVVLSVLVQPGYEQARGADYRFQHWSAWVEQGLVDLTTPACFHGDLPGLEKQLWEVRSIHMGSPVPCVPGLMVNPALHNHPHVVAKEQHPFLQDQRRLLRSAGFQYCNIMDYQALVAETADKPGNGAPRRSNGFWGMFRSKPLAE